MKYTLNGTSDRGSVGIELLNYSGEGDIVYHTLNEPDVTVLACGNLEIAMRMEKNNYSSNSFAYGFTGNAHSLCIFVELQG